MLSNPDVEIGYQKDQERREYLANLVEQTMRLLLQLQLKDEAAITQILKQTVLRDTFKVMVIGEFKTGKSTFINALLGDEVLPSYARPCTAVVAEVQWGDMKKAVLHWRDEKKNPFEIQVQQLEEYVVIREDEKEVRESPYSKVELFWPLPILKNNVEIIDSPGLNENEIREKVTLEYLRRVDAVLFVFTAVRLGPSIHEAEAIENLRNSGHEEIFFVINRWDQLRERDKVDVRQWADGRLRPLSKRSESIYYVSSLDALEGRLDGDEARIARSGILQLEAALTHFLTTDRARIKLLRASQELRLIIQTFREIIPHRRGMLEQPLVQLRQKYKEAASKLRELELDVASITHRVSNHRSDMRELVRNKTREFYANVNMQVDVWLQDLEIGFFEGLSPNKVAEKIGEHLAVNLKTEAERWTKGTLQPFVDERMSSLIRELESRTDAFEQKLQQTQFDLSGHTNLTGQALQISLDGPKTPLERALAAAGGWVIGGPAVAALGGAFGMQEVVSAIIPQFVAILGALIIGLPVLPVALVVGALQGGRKLLSVGKQIKDAVALKFRDELHKYSTEHAEKIAQRVDTELKRFEEQLGSGLQIQVSQIRQQAESTLEEKEQGEASVERHKREIAHIETELNDLEKKLFDFTANLVSQ
jgi:GTPase SAR1 family protein